MADQGVALTPTSYVVLGLVASAEPVTSYELKQLVALSIGHFWPFPHSQLYAEPARLVRLGLLSEKVETSGRRRRHYSITNAGREALASWLSEPTRDAPELRDMGLLKLFFLSQADPDQRLQRALAQQAVHESGLRQFEALHEMINGIADPWQLRTLELGLRFQRMAVDFWAEVAAAIPSEAPAALTPSPRQ